MPLITSTIRIVALSASLALGATSVAWADSPINLPGSGSSNTRIAVAITAAESAKGKVTEISAKLKDARQKASAVRERLANAEKILRDLQAKADSAATLGETRRQLLATKGAQCAPLKDAYEQAKVEAIREFNGSPEYRAALEAVNTAAANLRPVQAEAVRPLSMTEEYRKAWDAMRAADAALATAGEKLSPDSAELAAYTKAAAEARTQVESLRDHRLAIDPNVQIAKARVASAKAAFDELKRRFIEEELPLNPKVAAAQQPLKTELIQCDSLSAEATSADQQLADAQAAVKLQNDSMIADRKTFGELSAIISQCEGELPGAEADADKATADLDRAKGEVAATPTTPDTETTPLPVPTPTPTPTTAVDTTTPTVAAAPLAVHRIYRGLVYVRVPVRGGGYILQARPYLARNVVIRNGVRVYVHH